jgi:hypothetical protein
MKRLCPESLSAFREGHWGSIISILLFLLENEKSSVEKKLGIPREVTSPGPWPLIFGQIEKIVLPAL